MFGAALLPAITVGQALGIDGAIRRRRAASVTRPLHPTSEPGPTITDMSGGGSASGFDVIEPTKDHGIADHTEPCPTIKAGGNYDKTGKQGGGLPPVLRVIGGGRNHPKDKDGKYRRDKRDITDEPSTTVAGYNGATTPSLFQKYRWSDAMREKHPPASPASPAPTVMSKFYKGGAEGLLAVDEVIDRPCNTISSGGTSTGGAEPVAHAKREGYIRRLLPTECLRLQSAPDDFKLPEGISKTNVYRIAGNGWASRMGHVMAQAFRAADHESVTVIDLYCGGGLGACGWHGRFWEYKETE